MGKQRKFVKIKLTDFLEFIAKMGVGEETSISKDAEPMSNTDTLKEKKIVRTAEEVRKMTATQYLDELVVPILNKALITVNKERPVNPIEFLGNHLIKVANEPPSPEETKSISSASTPTPMD